MSRPRTRATPTARTRPHTDHDETADPTQHPYGPWYPLVRLGHFMLMALTSCLIILTGLGLLSLLIYVGITLTK